MWPEDCSNAENITAENSALPSHNNLHLKKKINILKYIKIDNSYFKLYYFKILHFLCVHTVYMVKIVK